MSLASRLVGVNALKKMDRLLHHVLNQLINMAVQLLQWHCKPERGRVRWFSDENFTSFEQTEGKFQISALKSRGQIRGYNSLFLVCEKYSHKLNNLQQYRAMNTISYISFALFIYPIMDAPLWHRIRPLVWKRLSVPNMKQLSVVESGGQATRASTPSIYRPLPNCSRSATWVR